MTNIQSIIRGGFYWVSLHYRQPASSPAPAITRATTIAIIIATIMRTGGTIAGSATSIAADPTIESTTSIERAAMPDQWLRLRASARLHADAAVDADAFAIDVIILDDRHRQLCDLAGFTQPFWIQHRFGERVQDFRVAGSPAAGSQSIQGQWY